MQLYVHHILNITVFFRPLRHTRL